MKSVSATNARKQLFELIEQAGKPGSFISITHRDLPGVVLMSYEEFAGWEETVEILSDKKLMADIRSGLKERDSITLKELEKKFTKRKK